MCKIWSFLNFCKRKWAKLILIIDNFYLILDLFIEQTTKQIAVPISL